MVISVAILTALVVMIIVLGQGAAVPTITYSMNQIQPCRFPKSYCTDAVTMAPGSYLHGTLIGKNSTLTGANCVQTVTITGGPTGGSFILSFGAPVSGLGVYQTVPIAFNAPAATLAAALAALTSIGLATNVTVTLVGSTYTITFVGACGNIRQPAIQLVSNSLTGGTSPAVIIAVTTQGNNVNGAWEPYLATNTDGSQFPKALLIYDTIVDTFGNHFSGGGEWLAPGVGRTCPVAVAGYFKAFELTGLDANACGSATGFAKVVDGSINNLTDPGTVVEIL